ncbi:MAG: hypothetical protein RBS72_05900 [Sedimentisphaerales bacterium]|jgi:hypothetical protein|nr:hypothetical protein [Sedimentisphaerales bacterium]HNY79331.1 hypothetical protein [Sedimentisphaerales bacterium]HOC64471.1 hypothetical protein [Sedimentisphaerales bacterium]HOH63334.1 hypothetical protein [Sedimentisphaerales bacterium]HPY49941.1 hypothetical protein [Sedimentisphaerales bacterium]
MRCVNVVRLPIAAIVVACCLAESSALRAASGGRSDPAPVLYPHELDKRPALPSPCLAEDGTEIVTAVLKNGKYVCIPVTVENGKPLHYSYRVPLAYGKDQQLHVNRDDFPTLAQTGLHAEAELDATRMITGFPVDLITYIGRPGQFSGAGFLANDETILSVLKGDNKLVRKLGLTHPQMARPLYHVWNMILQDIEHGTFRRFSSIPRFFYNDQEIALRAESTKGWQISIFQDEIQGMFDISVRRTLTAAEDSFLRRTYRGLSGTQMTELQEKLTHLRFSEMLPYYVMGYGFYEGHTGFRADPITIACIFGLRSIEEIENAFPGRLYETLTRHFTDTGRADSKP